MSRILLKTSVGKNKEFKLKPGINSVGRGEDNDVVIPDPSMSRQHCRIIINGSVAEIQDLQSSNGTFINGKMIQKGLLYTGMKLKLGSMEMVFEGDENSEIAIPTSSLPPRPIDFPSGPNASLPASIPAATPLKQTTTKEMPKEIPAVFIPQQQAPEPVPEKTTVPVMLRLVGQKPPRVIPPMTGFLQDIPRAITYPMRQNGAVILLFGAVFLSLINVIQAYAAEDPMVGAAIILLLVIGTTSILYSFYKDIVASSARGSDQLPGWPSITSVAGSILLPFFECLALVILFFGLAIVSAAWLSTTLGFLFAASGSNFRAYCYPVSLLVGWNQGIESGFDNRIHGSHLRNLFSCFPDGYSHRDF